MPLEVTHWNYGSSSCYYNYFSIDRHKKRSEGMGNMQQLSRQSIQLYSLKNSSVVKLYQDYVGHVSGTLTNLLTHLYVQIKMDVFKLSCIRSNHSLLNNYRTACIYKKKITDRTHWPTGLQVCRRIFWTAFEKGHTLCSYLEHISISMLTNSKGKSILKF